MRICEMFERSNVRTSFERSIDVVREETVERGLKKVYSYLVDKFSESGIVFPTEEVLTAENAYFFPLS